MRMTLRLDRDLEAALDAESRSTGRPKNRIVVDALRASLGGRANQPQTANHSAVKWSPLPPEKRVKATVPSSVVLDELRADVLVTYDKRLAEAAAASNLRTASPA